MAVAEDISGGGGTSVFPVVRPMQVVVLPLLPPSFLPDAVRCRAEAPGPDVARASWAAIVWSVGELRAVESAAEVAAVSLVAGPERDGHSWVGAGCGCCFIEGTGGAATESAAQDIAAAVAQVLPCGLAARAPCRDTIKPGPGAGS